MKRNVLKAAGAVVCLVIAILAGFRFYMDTEAFITEVGRQASAIGSELLGTRVDIGGVRINSLRSVSAEGLTVYDKQGKKLAEAESAEVRFSLFDVLFGKEPAAAISEVIVEKPGAYITQRADDTWNYEDLLQGESKDSGFRGTVVINHGFLELTANTSGKKQVKERTEEINASIRFLKQAMELEATTLFKGEKVRAKGRVNTGEKTELNLAVDTEDFELSKAMKDSPFKGKVSAEVKITGPTDALDIRGVASAKEGSLYGYEFKNAKARAAFAENILTLYELEGEIFGGPLKAAMELDTTNLYFDGTAKLSNLDTSLVGDVVPGLAGKVTADLGFKGEGTNTDALSIFGSVAGKGLTYEGITTEEIHASFAKLGRDLTVDFLAVKLSDGGELGFEGTIKDLADLDCKFYGSHLDLSLLRQVNPQIDMEGFADFRGKLKGNKDNPELWAQFSAIKGKLFKQPFNTLHGEASGSLDGLMVKNFALENGAQDVWTVKGTVGFTGAKRLDLQIDTVGARMEDLAALVAPDQPITGNLDNTITVTGTLDNPEAAGYIHFYRGSYAGYLLQGMDGDYTLRDGVMTLKDFHVFSPMVDMDLNGTMDRQFNLDMTVAVQDVSLKRMGGKLPYPIDGHGHFSGKVSGTVSSPVFDGMLYAQELDFNGIKVANAQGRVNYRGREVSFKNFGFEQNDGTINLSAEVNVDSLKTKGLLKVESVELNNLLAMFNFKNDALYGKFGGTVEIGGVLTNPSAHLIGFLPQGSFRGYDFHDLAVDAGLHNRVITLGSFSGKQGASGVFVADGTIDLTGPLNLTFSAKGIQAGILPKAAGVNVDMSGLMDIEVNAHGSLQDPQAEGSLEILSGGIRGSGFDSIKGLFTLKNQVLNVDQFIIQKQEKEHGYKVAAYGALPLKALFAERDYDGDAQFNLRVSLEQGDMSILPMLVPQIDWAFGDTFGDFLITGTMARPLVHGAVGVKNGALKIKKVGIPITEINTKISFNGDDIVVDECTGRMGKGSYKLTGAVSLAGEGLENYNLQFEADKLEIVSDVYKGPFTMSMGISEGSFYHHQLPKLTGRIFIDETTLSVPSIPESEGELPEFIVDVTLELGKKVRFYSPYIADLKLGGSAHFGGTTRYPQSSGHIGVLRGKVSYLKIPFTVREGELVFNNAGSYLPSVRFYSDTKIDKTKVFLMINGPIGQMKFKLKSIPDMRESEILKLLTFRKSSTNSNDIDYSATAMEIGLQMAFLNELERQVRDFLQLDEFTITRDTENKKGDKSSRQEYNVEVGKYISEKVMLKYIHGLGSNPVRRFGAQYDFTDRMSMTVLYDEHHAFRFGLEARFRF